MLYFIVVWLILFVVCCPIGTALLNKLPNNGFDRTGDRLIVSAWLGLVMLSIALLATSLILPLSPLVGGVVAIGLSAASLEWQQTREELAAVWARVPHRVMIGVLGLALLVAALTTGQVVWHDTGYYHYGLIQWLAEYGTVPGLSLLFTNLGFTSSWFALAAPLNAQIFDARVSAVTNGFVLLIAVLQALICLRQSLMGARLSDLFAIAFALIMLPITIWLVPMSQILVSPSPDLPVAFLVGIVGWSMLVVSRSTLVANEMNDSLRATRRDRVIPLILATGAFTIKLTALPLVVMSSLFFVFHPGVNLRRIVRGGAVVLLLLSPMLISGILTSGCPLYPAAVLCVDLPWSPTSQAVQQTAANTHGWTTWYGSPPSGVNPWIWSIGQWFNTSTTEKITAALIVLALGAAVYVIVTQATKLRGEIWVAAIGVLGITFLMLTSPFFRFNLPYVALLLALSMAVVFMRQFDRILHFLKFLESLIRSHDLVFNLFSATVVLVVVGYSYPQLLLPLRMKDIPVVEKQANGIVYFYPEDNMHCWAAKIPCTFTDMQEVEFANPNRGLAGGFIRKKSF
ncbi:LIC_10190 family membrane protein [Phormidesmis sp. 146-35]